MRDFPALERKRDKVALVGFSSSTRHLAPYDDDEWSVWSLNEAHRQPWLKRLTRHFQMHAEWDFNKGGDQSYIEHREWLRKEHPFPIYMQEEFPDIPSSVAFPLDEVVAEFLPTITREGEIIRYFTSSFAYMCSLALLEGFKTIGIWGFDMGTETEFKYQKPSTEFWLGVAAGRGVEIQLPKICQLLRGGLYGYEVSRMINRQRLEHLQGKWEEQKVRQMAKYNIAAGKRQQCEELYAEATDDELKKHYKSMGSGLLDQEIRALNKANALYGRVQMLEDLIKVVDNMQDGKDDWDGPISDAEVEGDIEREPPPVDLVLGNG